MHIHFTCLAKLMEGFAGNLVALVSNTLTYACTCVSVPNNCVFKLNSQLFVTLELEELSKHGITMPPNMQGLTDDQIIDLKLYDNWAGKCVPSGGVREVKDPMSKRNGKGILVKFTLLLFILIWQSNSRDSW